VPVPRTMTNVQAIGAGQPDLLNPATGFGAGTEAG